MIFESRVEKSPVQQRVSLPWVYQRRRSSTNLQENKVQILVMGSDQVGKSTMVDLFTKNKVVIEDDLDEKRDLPVEIIVELMDVKATTSATLRKFVIQTAHAFILVYSFDNPESLSNVRKLKDEIENIKGKGMPMIVVGNKVDICNQKMDFNFKKKENFSRDDIPHIRVSFRSRLYTNDVYKVLFQHKTLLKYTNIVSKINSSQVFSEYRRLSLKADALEEAVSKCFIGNVSKNNMKENKEHFTIFKKHKNLLL